MGSANKSSHCQLLNKIKTDYRRKLCFESEMEIFQLPHYISKWIYYKRGPRPKLSRKLEVSYYNFDEIFVFFFPFEIIEELH